MSADPETILNALLAQLKDGVGNNAKTYGRRVRLWSEVNLLQPAIFVRHAGDDDVWAGDGLQSTAIMAEVWVYAKTPLDGSVPDTNLNAVVKAIRAAMAPPVGEEQLTLGGLVLYARIDGRSMYDPGDLDQQGKAIITVKCQLDSTYP